MAKNDKYADAFNDLEAIDKQIAELTKKKADINTKLMKWLREEPENKSDDFNIAGKDHHFTLVQGQTMVLDAVGLKKDLSAAQWRKIVTEALDKKKLEAAVEQKLIDPKVVRKHTNMVDKAPYVRVY